MKTMRLEERNYPCTTCDGEGVVSGWQKGHMYSRDPATHVDAECPHCTSGVVTCAFAELDVADLCEMPDFIAETPLSQAECVAAAAAIHAGDAAALGYVFLDAIVREANRLVFEKTKNGDASRSGAIVRLEALYKSSPERSAA